MYLAAVKDMATREIVGWSMADHLRSSLCENALMMAIQHRVPPRGLIHHSDRGVQYACGPYRKILDRYGIQASMSRKGDCYDNAPMESFFSSLKTELVHRTQFRTRREAKAALFEYIEIFYNRSSQRTSRYVVGGNKVCWFGSDTVGCFGLLRTRRARACAAGPWRVTRLKIQGPFGRGCSASISPRSVAILSVRGATPTKAAA